MMSYDLMQMMILDFSKHSVSEVIKDLKTKHLLEWQIPVLTFLEEWNNNLDWIQVKTSGSTGKPKTISHLKSAMKNSAEATVKALNLKKGNTALLCLPVQYIAGKMMLVRSILVGLKIVCLEPKVKLNLNDSVSFDFCAMTPMQVEQSLPILNQIETLIIGGAPVSEQLQNQLSSYQTKVYETYGMTETITHIALKKLNPQPIETYFKCLANVQIGTDARGCLNILAPKIHPNIIQTNDLVKLVDQEKFEWLGRADFVINSGGIKLHPEQIEHKLQSKFNQNILITSLPDDILGEKVVLIIEGKTENLNEEVFKNLEKFEKPKKIYFLDAFARTANGKIQRIETKNKLIQKITT